MTRRTPAIKAAINMADRGESLTLMEPLLLSENSRHRKDLLDLALTLVAKAASFRSSLPVALQSSLANIVRAMNCYYSNLIEGHNTKPIDIENALKGHYSRNPAKRNLQKEAKAHIAVQEWIDRDGTGTDFYSTHTLCEIHRRFYKLLPDELLWISNIEGTKKLKVIPGKIRTSNVKVGDHIAISPGAVKRFLTRIDAVYSHLSTAETLLSLAASHHRLLWIHPFLDGNGRIARLMSHAVVMKTLDTGSLWSIARGLARNVGAYKEYLINCDLTRRNDLDGRGNLSEEALAAFTKFFLEICIDQVSFMEKLMQPNLLRSRILLWAKEEVEAKILPQVSLKLLEAILYQGELTRAEVPKILNLSERHARRFTSDLIEQGILTSDTSKSPVKIAFPPSLAERWLPGLFPSY